MREITDTDSFNSEVMVRPDLREDAFRRYEPFIAKAARSPKGIYLTPADFPVGKKHIVGTAKTFICRFGDAKLAYKRFGYKSTMIPEGFDHRDLVARELANGDVVIENHAFRKVEVPILTTADKVRLTQLVDGLISGAISGPINIRVVSDADYQWLLDKAKEHYGNLAVGELDSNGCCTLL